MRALRFGAVAVLLGTLISFVTAVPRSGAAVPAGAVTMTVADVRPNTPRPTQVPRKLEISLSLRNDSDQTLADVRISAVRAVPIDNQADLDAAIAKPVTPTGQYIAPLDATEQVTLAPGASVDVLYTTSTDVPTDADLCLCANAIYQLFFYADYTPDKGTTQRIATADTFVPSFVKTPAKTRVAWVWPLLDRPHRLGADRLFLDDDLAAEVAPGGRLDELLRVVEDVGPDVPMTLVVDPELIDELAVMSTRYRVKSTDGPVAGTGQDDAQAWLARLRGVLALPGMEVSLTPYADPPVETLRRAGLSWTVALGPDARARVTAAFGGSLPSTDISWPANQTVTDSTLATLVSQGTNTVILSDKTLPKGANSTVVPDALAPLSTTSGPAIAAVTSTPLDRDVRRVLEPRGAGLAALPELVANLAMRVETSLDTSHFVVLTPPRNLRSIDPLVAERLVRATAQTPWSEPLPLRAATTAVAAVDHGTLQGTVTPLQLPSRTLAALRYVIGALPDLGSLFRTKATRTRLASSMPTAIQRSESTSLLYERGHSGAFAPALARQIRHVRSRVVLVRPTDGTYTLASSNATLPVTIRNRLDEPVQVIVGITSAPGFTAKPITVRIDAASTVQVRVATHVDRVGLFTVQVNVSTPEGLPLSAPLTLTIHSNSLGTIGVIITVIAGIVLVVALFLRYLHRVRYRGRARMRAAAAKAAATPSATPSASP